MIDQIDFRKNSYQPIREKKFEYQTHSEAGGQTPSNRSCEPRFDGRTLTVLLITMLFMFLAGAGGASAHRRDWDTAGMKDITNLLSIWKNLRENHTDIREWAITPEGEWVIVSENNHLYFSSGFPPLPRLHISVLFPFGIDTIAFTPDGDWAVTAGSAVLLSEGVPRRDLLREKITTGLSHNGGRLTELAFTADGRGWVVTAGGWAWHASCPADLVQAVKDTLYSSHREITNISISTDGRWVLAADHWFASSRLPSHSLSRLNASLRNQREISKIVIGPKKGYLLYSHGSFQARNAMERLELDVIGDNIYQRMHEANIQGISLAVIENNKIAYARGYGVLEAGTQRWVRHDSPFDLASLSKFLGALTQMTLVEDGYLSLDSDAFTMAFQSGTIQDWNRQLTTPVGPGVSLARLLSHTAGTKPHGSTSIWPGNWPPQGVTTLQLLEGFNDPGEDKNPVTWEPVHWGPGDHRVYSGGGFLLADAMAEHVTGQDFSVLMQDRLFDALGMEDSVAAQPLASHWQQRAAILHNDEGVPQESRPIYPWTSAGGVYASATDYARAMIVLMRDGLDENGNRLLQSTTVDEMLKDWTPDSSSYGLGLYVKHNWLYGTQFWHGGKHGLGSRTQMWADLNGDIGIVVLVNGEDSNDLAKDLIEAFKWKF